MPKSLLDGNDHDKITAMMMQMSAMETSLEKLASLITSTLMPTLAELKEHELTCKTMITAQMQANEVEHSSLRASLDESWKRIREIETGISITVPMRDLRADFDHSMAILKWTLGVLTTLMTGMTVSLVVALVRYLVGF